MSGVLRLVFFGDDFTGSTDALEVLAFAGLRTALFLAPPGAELLARYPDLDAIGVAGDSRGMSRAEIDREMPAILDGLRSVGAPIVHYKVCSTFDSSPETGSIGRVIELAGPVFGNRFTPVIGGTPALGRYCLFGNLFARFGPDGEVFRIDRHPVMSVHPVTPMEEGDLALHLRRQADITVAKLAFPDLEGGPEVAASALERAAAQAPDAVLIDAGREEHGAAAAALLDREAGRGSPLFVVGGSGVEYALVRHWGIGLDEASRVRFEAFPPSDRLLVMSGSASRVTAGQIDAALAAGFVEVAIDPVALLADGAATEASLIDEAVGILGRGGSPLLHTVRGPDDPRIGALRRSVLERDGADALAGAGLRIGRAQGRVLAAILERSGVRRVVVAGGDTSSQAVQVLAPVALEATARLAPGVPLCRLYAPGRSVDGLEIALKSGQFGPPDFFDTVRTGRSA